MVASNVHDEKAIKDATRPGIIGVIVATTIATGVGSMTANPEAIAKKAGEHALSDQKFQEYAEWAAQNPAEAEANIHEAIAQWQQYGDAAQWFMPVLSFVLVLKAGGKPSQAMLAAALTATYGIIGRAVAHNFIIPLVGTGLATFAAPLLGPAAVPAAIEGAEDGCVECCCDLEMCTSCVSTAVDVACACSIM